ncbi:nucleolar protein,Nop52-domain-containing protein [Coniochaeta sp. 2T2.1]|nr:nucleolar protein,Nop52-domain-containing protein [Coniochaeta sp. 2T2.1]
MESQERNMPFIKNLASSDRKLRTKSLESLRNFLSARQVASSLSTLDILKLWKGLFYALWMCDRPLPQQALAQDLADLIYVLPGSGSDETEIVETWLRGFWATMAREWTGVDVLRLEKFLLLVRRVLGASLAWMKVREQEEGKDGGAKKRKSSGKEKKQKGKWDAKQVDAVVGVLADYPFVLEEDAQPRKRDGEEADEEEGEEDKYEAEVKLTPAFVPVGLKLHVLDIWVDEAEKVGLLEDEDEEAKDILRRITEIVDGLEKGTVSPGVRIRARQSLLDDRLPFTNIAGSDAGSE